MDVYQEAVGYLESQQVPVESEAKTEALEEEEEVSSLLSPLDVDSFETPETPTFCSPEEMLQRRLVVLRGILRSEEVYLRQLDALLTPMKALWASAGTSQPVLSSQEVQTIFYQVPEIRDMHQSFSSGLKARLSGWDRTGSGSDEGEEKNHSGFDLIVGDLFLKMVNQLGLYGGFIGNYEEAVEVVRRCSQADVRFRTLAESMMPNDGSGGKYTFEALLYQPLDRVTKTTLVLRDVLKATPDEHGDRVPLQVALRLSRSFLAGVNESSLSRREVTLSHAMTRRLVRDGFVVDASEGERSLRHLFLFTDLLLCTRFKHAARGKQDHYRFCWYLPLARLKLRWAAEPHPPDLRLHAIRSKMYLLRQQEAKASRILAARSRKKLEQMELMLLTHSPRYRLELHSSTAGTHLLLFSSLYDLEEWRAAIHQLTTDGIETVPPDLLTLTGSCVKLRMTQQPPLRSAGAEDEDSLCGTLGVAVHAARGLQQPACVYVCLEVDGYASHHQQAQTHSSVLGLNPHWDQELCFQVDGAQQLKVVCVSQGEGQQDDAVLAKTWVQLDPKTVDEGWRRQTLSLGQVKLAVSLRFRPHLVGPPTLASQEQPVFGVPLEAVARQEGGLVPHVVRCCVEEVERRGMDEVGIYRVSGAAQDIGTLKVAFHTSLREAVARLRSAEVNVVSGLLKLYFRELPEPLVPTRLFHSLAQMLDIQEVETRLGSMVTILQSCPEPNRNTFLYLLHHLQRVSEKQATNKMSPMNLATVFGPSLLRPPVAGPGQDAVPVDISQEVVVQVQVVFWFLQCRHLPEARTSLQPDSDEDEDEEESTYL